MNILSKHNKSILREMVATDFKVRYQGSVLGYTWSVLRPLFVFIILYIVFVKFLRIGSDIPFFAIYLLLGIVLWQFFADTTNTAMTAVVGRGDLIKKISIPKYLVVLSAGASAFINLMINLGVVMLFVFFAGVDVKLSWLLFPVYIIELFVLAMALGFFLSALFVKYRDASYVWEIGLQAGFYATPVIYPLTIVSERFQSVLMLNPVAQIIQDARWSLVSHDTLSSWKVLDMPLLIIPFVIIIFIVLIAVRYFKKESYYFAERI